MIYRLTQDCFWGDHFTASDTLQEAGVQAVLCVAHNVDICPTAYSMPFCRVPMSDNAQLEPWQIGTALGFMRMCASEGIVPLFIMCRAGQSRSAAFAAAWLTMMEGCAYTDAMERVRAVRPNVFPHPLPWQQIEIHLRKE